MTTEPAPTAGRARPIRLALQRLHRWLGLSTAVFLFVSGLTGALISWDHQLDAWLNPGFYVATSTAPARFSGLELADRLEAAEPGALVTWVPLATSLGDAITLGVLPRVDPATGTASTLAYNQIAFDPATGAEQAHRTWGAVSLARQDVLPFLYKLHYSLHLPAVGGFETGVLLMGLVAIVWMIDSFVSLVIAFPSRRTWRSSLRFRLRAGPARLLFDLHRSGGVWAWALLLVLATTAVSMNLGPQVMRPVVGALFDLRPDPLTERPLSDPPAVPGVDRATIVAIAKAEGARRGFEAPPGGVFYLPQRDLYGVGFYAAGDEHGDVGLGNPWIYLDGRDGSLVGDLVPGTGSLGDVFLQAQFPLHSGRILGVPGRILVSLLGLVVAALSATGVALWARRLRWRRRTAIPAPPLEPGRDRHAPSPST